MKKRFAEMEQNIFQVILKNRPYKKPQGQRDLGLFKDGFTNLAGLMGGS